MTLPDEGQVEAYTEEEMKQLLDKFENDKASLTKNQKAAIARYNFKKNKGEPITYKGQAPPPAAEKPAADAAPAAAPAAGGVQVPPEILALLPPEIQKLAAKDPATMTKEEKISLAKAKSQAVKAQQAKKDADTGGKDDTPKESPEELARKKAIASFAGKALIEKFGDRVTDWTMMVDAPYATVQADDITTVAQYARDKLGFTYLRNLTAADYVDSHLAVVYNFYNMDKREHLALRVKLPREVEVEGDLPTLPSVTPLFPGADWLEREVFDLFGIRFQGHPYMRRIMLPDGWNGYPLRKDYDSSKEQFVGLATDGSDIVSYRSEDGW